MDCADKKVSIMTSDKDDSPKIVVTKLNPQLMKLWDTELARLHKALVDPNTADAEKQWIKARIEELHRKIFD